MASSSFRSGGAGSGSSEDPGTPPSGEAPETLEGGTITIGLNGDVTLNGRANGSVADIEVRNGGGHLDVLLRRTNAVQRAFVTPNFSVLADLASQAGLADDLGDKDGTFTVLAPTNDVFLVALDGNDNGEMDDGEGPNNVFSSTTSATAFSTPPTSRPPRLAR
jgi:transforming growth factor-beta-induced protein